MINFPRIRLPDTETKVDPSAVGHFLVDALFGDGDAVKGAATRLFKSGLKDGIDEMLLARQAMKGRLAEWKQESLDEFEEWLETLQYGLINISGEPGEGKTTCACDLADRYFDNRRIYCIGIPQEVLPKGWTELPISKLDGLGRKIAAAARADKDPKDLIADFLPLNSLVIVDDAGLYLSSGKAADKPANQAIRQIIDVRRHLGLVILATFQSYFGIDFRFSTAADAYIFKQSNLQIAGGDRPEILRMLREAVSYFEDYGERKSNEGLARKEIKASRQFLAWVVCREVAYIGPWRHKRPKWYGMAMSRNAVHGVIELEPEDYSVTEADFEADEEGDE